MLTEAINATWRSLDHAEQGRVARALGYSPVTVYQWGETDDEGRPRREMPSSRLALWTALTGSRLALDAISEDAEHLGGTLRRNVPRADTMARATRAIADMAEVFRDEIISLPDRHRLRKELLDLIEALDHTRPIENRS